MSTPDMRDGGSSSVLVGCFGPLVVGIAVPLGMASGRGVDRHDVLIGTMIVLGGYPFLWGLRGLRRTLAQRARIARRLGGEPLASFAEARDGEAALISGKVVEGPGGVLLGPVTGERCAFARAAILDRWGVSVAEETVAEELALEDASGQRLTVLVRGGRVEPKEARFVEESETGIDAFSAPAQRLAQGRRREPDAPLVCEERALLVGETVLARGLFRIAGDSYRAEGGLVLVHGSPELDQDLLVTNRTPEEALEHDQPSIVAYVRWLVIGLVVLLFDVAVVVAFTLDPHARGAR